MTLEDFNPEKSRSKIYLPEVRAIIEVINNESEDFLKKREKDLASMADKKDTLYHSRRTTNLGYLLAKERKFSEEGNKLFVETCFSHDVGKLKLPIRSITKPSSKFELKDLKKIEKHSILGYLYLKQEKRSPRVYNPILIHHEFQKRPYPDTKASMLRILGAMEDIDVDNGRLLAILDNFETSAFGRSYTNIKPMSSLDRVKEWIQVEAGFNQAGDEEIIDFLCSQYETIKELNKN